MNRIAEHIVLGSQIIKLFQIQKEAIPVKEDKTGFLLLGKGKEIALQAPRFKEKEAKGLLNSRNLRGPRELCDCSRSLVLQHLLQLGGLMILPGQ